MEDSLLISVVAASQSLATITQSTASQARSEADCPLGTLTASVITSSYSGPAPSEVVVARTATTAFSGKLVSNPCSLLFLAYYVTNTSTWASRWLAALKPPVNIFNQSSSCILERFNDSLQPQYNAVGFSQSYWLGFSPQHSCYQQKRIIFHRFVLTFL